jgi:hypothetical protein
VGVSVRGAMPDGIYVRITPLDNPLQRKDKTVRWVQDGYTAHDILAMIRGLQPDVLDRFMTGKQNPADQVPGRRGLPEMTVLQFLNAATQAGAPGCILVPKVHLNPIWSVSYRQEALTNLRDLPVRPPIRAVSFDGWFATAGPAEQRKRLRGYRAMGWTDLGYNFGSYKRTHGYGSFGMVSVDRHHWEVQPGWVKMLEGDRIKTRLVHIDYPKAIQAFGKLPPDRQADIITKEICPAQRQHGFRFIYPVLYGGYDATKMKTTKTGPYKGATIYQIIQQMIAQDRKLAAARP